jgi:hypothetical protein
MFGTDPVEVWRAPVVQGTYTSRTDWDQAVKVWSGTGSVQPYRAFESFSPDRATSQERKTLYLPPSAVVASGDRVAVAGAMYEVDGEPEVWGYTSRRHLKANIWRALK